MLLSTKSSNANSRMFLRVVKVAYSHPRGDRKKVKTPRVKKYNLTSLQTQLKRNPSMLGFP